MNVKQARSIYLGTNKIYKVYFGNIKIYDAFKKFGGYLSTAGKYSVEAINRSATLVFLGKPNKTYKIKRKASTRFRGGVYNSDTLPAGANVSNFVSNDTGSELLITTTTNNYYVVVYYWTSSMIETENEMYNDLRIEEV